LTRSDQADARATAALALLREAAETLKTEQAARVATEAEAADLRLKMDQARADAQEAARAAEAEAAQLRQAVDQARTEADQAVEALRQAEVARAAAQATEAAERPAMVASRIDEVQLRRLQEAERVRKSLGRFARLRLAWRGE
jgi:hypothetical protein